MIVIDGQGYGSFYYHFDMVGSRLSTLQSGILYGMIVIKIVEFVSSCIFITIVTWKDLDCQYCFLHVLYDTIMVAAGHPWRRVYLYYHCNMEGS